MVGVVLDINSTIAKMKISEVALTRAVQRYRCLVHSSTVVN